MSVRDRRLIDGTVLNLTKLAELAGRSRQAVKRGIDGSEDYFTAGELARIAEKSKQAEDIDQEASEKIHEVIANLLREIADEVGRSAPGQLDVFSAIAEAKVLWLALPDFATSYNEQPKAYHRLFGAINARKPAKSDPDGLRVIVWCANPRFNLRRRFDKSWGDSKRATIITADMVDALNIPMVIVDPDLDGGQACYALAASGFAQIAPMTARSRVQDLAEKLAGPLKDADIADDPFDLIPEDVPENLVLPPILQMTPST